ncbi:replication protein [Acinetobacter larvae]|uniref:Replication protein n=1 Tax=Acinetobacter larvae TaxID=1789224 RepID=A0A1B2M3Z0_9GAMM|nr:replication protein [Acinetobacter larvae]AOA59920.1 replication protein [Acinetobacter larvae]
MSSFTPNAFQVPNAFVDEVLDKISDAACKMYLVICRKTRGWNKEYDAISLTQFEEITGKSRPTVIKCLRELIKVGLVVELKSTFHGNTYKLGDETSIGLVVNFPSKNILLDENQESTSKKSLPLLVKKFNYASKNILPLLVKNFYTQTITINKHSTKIKKINKKSDDVTQPKKPVSKNSFDAKSIDLPVNVNRDLWNQFADMRSENKKPLTENAVNLILRKLVDFGDLANQSLENSIIGNYQGVFQPKPQLAQQQSSHSRMEGFEQLRNQGGDQWLI